MMKILPLAEIGLCHFKQKSIEKHRQTLQKHSDIRYETKEKTNCTPPPPKRNEKNKCLAASATMHIYI